MNLLEKGFAILTFRAYERVIARLIPVFKNAFYVLFYLISKATLRPEVSILMYHSVESNDSRYSVDPKEFYRQMDYLRKNYRVVSLEDIRNFVEGRKILPRKSVAITLDDGYSDNYLNAYPYLKKYNLPATIFIATEYIQKKMLLGNIHLVMLSWNAIREMSKNNINIGANTTSHPDLKQIDLKEAKNEILSSKKEIEKNIGKEVNYFAYPFGACNSDVVDLVKHLGFRCAVGGGEIIRKNADSFVLNRVQVDRSVSFMMFKMRLTLALNWYKKFEQIVKTMSGNFSFMSTIARVYNSLDS